MLCVFFTAWADDADYYVENWHYRAVVHENNVWDIREHIDVQFVQPHHGIFVYRPRIFTDLHDFEGEECFFTYKLQVRDVQVPGWNFITDTNEDSQQNYVIQIGDENVTLTGLQSYIISYTLVYPDDRIRTSDNIYHSVLGDGWPSNIRHFEFEIEFDKPLPELALDSCFVYSGPWNYHGDQWEVGQNTFISSYSLTGSIDNLPGGQAISFRISLPEGYFIDVPVLSPWLPYLLYGIAIVLGLWLVSFLISIRLKHPVPSVQFYPPEGMNSAEVGTIIDNTADVKDLVSLIPWFAQQGYIRISEQPGQYTWSKSKVFLYYEKDLPENAPEYQKNFLSALFPSGTISDLSKLGDRSSHISLALSGLKNQFIRERTLSNTSNMVWLLPLMAILMIFGYATDTRVCIFDQDKFIFGIIFASLQCCAAMRRFRYSEVRAYSRTNALWSTLVVLLLAALHMGLIWALHEPQDYFLSLQETYCIFGFSYFVLLLSDRFYTDTDYRIDTIGQLLGLREFIKTAEKKRLEMLVDEQPEYFYRILPYAMVFGLANRWADKFKDISIKTPDWYSGVSPSGDTLCFSGSQMARSFSNSLSTSVASYVSSSSHHPSSSSGGSGGGGGGGGGGAW